MQECRNTAGIVYRTAGTLCSNSMQDCKNTAGTVYRTARTLQEQYTGLREHSAGTVYRTAGTLCRTAHTRRNSDIICVQMQFYQNLPNAILYITFIFSDPRRWSLPAAIPMGHTILSPCNFTELNP
jgi:hypothetical protein